MGKIILFIFITSALVSCTIFRASPVKSIYKNFDDEHGSVMVVAHRANIVDSFPENSIPSIQACINNNIDIIEIDLQLTKDHKLILMHDETLNRMTNGSGKIIDKTWEEIKDLKLRNKSYGAVTDYEIPLFTDVLKLCKGKIMINVDKAFWYMNYVVTEAESYNMTRQIIVKNYDPKKYIDSIMGPNPYIYFMPILQERGYNNVKNAAEFLSDENLYIPEAFELIYDAPSDSIAQPDFWQMLENKGVRVWVNTLSDGLCGGYGDGENAIENWKYLINQGASIIQTDKCLELKKLIEEEGY